MRLLTKIAVFGAAVLVFIGGVGAALLFIASDGDPVSFVRTELLRFSLSARQDELETPYGTDATPRRFTIQSGETPFTVAQNLVNQQLIGDAELFVDYARLERLDRQIEAGTYFLRQTQTLPEIARMITDSRNSSITFRIFPGQRMEEIAQTIDSIPLFGFSGADFLALVGAGAAVDTAFMEYVNLPLNASLEGFLFADAYVLPPDITAVGLRDVLLNEFVNSVGMQARADALSNDLTLYEVVTLASIVQREAVHDDEKPLIAGVYLNRLAIDMKLDADPTVQYALNDTRGTWWAQITRADYQAVQSAYNTYIYRGLPPGPISNPSMAAIRAVIYPAESEYFFFRAKCDGSFYHDFSETFEEHLSKGC